MLNMGLYFGFMYNYVNKCNWDSLKSLHNNVFMLRSEKQWSCPIVGSLYPIWTLQDKTLYC